MGADKLKENFAALIGAVVKAKPASSKGVYVQGISVSSTMGPSVKVEPLSATASDSAN
jgi:large subunit ribosomal protein L1